jgi:hypothetical protein
MRELETQLEFYFIEQMFPKREQMYLNLYSAEKPEGLVCHGSREMQYHANMGKWDIIGYPKGPSITWNGSPKPTPLIQNNEK